MNWEYGLYVKIRGKIRNFISWFQVPHRQNHTVYKKHSSLDITAKSSYVNLWPKWGHTSLGKKRTAGKHAMCRLSSRKEQRCMSSSRISSLQEGVGLLESTVGSSPRQDKPHLLAQPIRPLLSNFRTFSSISHLSSFFY